MAVDKSKFDTTIALGEYGTQLFWFNPKSSDNSQTKPEFEYALPLVSGGEYGGDTETFDAPELDLDYVAKISGRTSLNDISLTSNYTKERYQRWVEILNNTKLQAYLEVFTDGSAVLYAGTAGRPTIQGGDVRQISVTVAPQNMVWVDNINSLGSDYVAEVNDLIKSVLPSDVTFTDLTAQQPLPFNTTTVPTKREWAYSNTHDGE